MTKAILREDLKGQGVPVGKLYYYGSKPLKMAWEGDDNMYVFFRNKWREAYSIDFDYIKAPGRSIQFDFSTAEKID